MVMAGALFHESWFAAVVVLAGQPAATAFLSAAICGVSTVDVVVVGVPLPEKSRAAEPMTTSATTATITERRIVRRRFASRCMRSTFSRRAAFCRSRFVVAMGATVVGLSKAAFGVR